MELRQLTFVMAVADAGSFTAAARRCHLSQSALSTQIAQLEAELGVRLFERTTRRVKLTEAGELFLPTACRVVELADELRAQMSAYTAGSLTALRVGSTQTATRVLDLPVALGNLRRRHGGVRITMTAGPSSELIGAVVDGSLDIALTSAVTPPPDPRLVFYPLAPHEPLVAIAPAGTSTTVPGSATLSELATSGPFIEFHAGSQLRTTVDALFRDAGLHREIIFELGQIGDVARCAAQGLGTAVVPRAFTAGLDLADSVMLEIEDRPTLTVGAYIRRSDRAPLVRAVLDVFASPSIDDA